MLVRFGRGGAGGWGWGLGLGLGLWVMWILTVKTFLWADVLWLLVMIMMMRE